MCRQDVSWAEGGAEKPLFLSELPVSGMFDGNKQLIDSAIPGITQPSRQTDSVPPGFAVT